QQIFEQGDTPARQRRDPPRLRRQVLQVRVPREGHEHIGGDQQQAADDGGRELHQSSLSTFWPWQESSCFLNASSGAISSNGFSTKARSCMRGWGRVSAVECIVAFPNSKMSRSSVRGAFGKLRWRP